MERWKGKVAIVTGASSGIGYTIAKGLLQNGLKVVAVARRMDKLIKLAADCEGLSKINLKCIKCDVSKEDEVKTTINSVTETWGPISVLVNSAGMFVPESISEGSAQGLKDSFGSNVFGMINFIREVIKLVKVHNVEEAHIININSIFGHQVMPIATAGTDTAAKYATTALTESLNHEIALEKLPIKATSLSPGLVNTEMAAKSITNIAELPSLQREDILNCVLFVLGTPKHVLISEITVKPTGETNNFEI